MKLRIKGNSLRLRLSQSEVDQVAAVGRCESKINFGNKALVYALNRVNTPEIFVEFQSDAINVFVPENQIQEWANSESVGFSRAIPLKEEQTLSLLVEKDFKCLTERTNENEDDLFHNPNEPHE